MAHFYFCNCFGQKCEKYFSTIAIYKYILGFPEDASLN